MRATRERGPAAARPSRSFPTKAWLAPLAAFGLPFLAYLSTLAPTITWSNGGADSGELAVAAFYLGIAHPSGYPLFVILGKLFTFLPFGNVAYRLNLMSAVFAASAVALTSLAVQSLLIEALRARKDVAALAAIVSGLLFAYSPTLWSQAVITEVYSLHILLVPTIVVILFQSHYGASPPGIRHLTALAFVCGLGIAHHLTILLLFPGVAFFLLASEKMRLLLLSWKGVLSGTVAFSLGLTPYLLLLTGSGRHPEANWGGGEDMPAFFAHVSGAAYRPLLLPGTDAGVFLRVASAAKLLLEQYGWIGFAAAVIGLWYLAHADRRLLTFWTVSALPVLGFAINYAARDSQVYLLPVYLFMAMAIGVGIAFAITAFAEELSFSSARYRKMHSKLRSWYTPVLLLSAGAWVAASAGASLPKVNLREDTEARDYALAALDALPEGSALLTNDDPHTFSLWYVQYVEGYRKDVVVTDTRLLNWPWYRKNLASIYPGISLEEPQGSAVQLVQQFINNNKDHLPIYSAFKAPYLAISEEQGQVFKIGQQ